MCLCSNAFSSEMFSVCDFVLFTPVVSPLSVSSFLASRRMLAVDYLSRRTNVMLLPFLSVRAFTSYHR